MVHKMGDRDQETPKGNTKTKTHDGQGRERALCPHTHLAGTPHSPSQILEYLVDTKDFQAVPRHLVHGI